MHNELLHHPGIAALLERNDFGEHTDCTWVAVDLRSMQPIDGDSDYHTLLDRVQSTGRNVKEFTIIGPKNPAGSG